MLIFAQYACLVYNDGRGVHVHVMYIVLPALGQKDALPASNYTVCGRNSLLDKLRLLSWEMNSSSHKSRFSCSSICFFFLLHGRKRVFCSLLASQANHGQHEVSSRTNLISSTFCFFSHHAIILQNSSPDEKKVTHSALVRSGYPWILQTHAHRARTHTFTEKKSRGRDS